MKFRLISLSFLLFLFISINETIAQEATEEDRPVFVTITTLQGADGFDFEEWKEIEEEYFTKVTSKIELLTSSEVLMSYFAPQFGEIKVINVINSWEDIITVNERREVLIEEAWPDEAERAAFFEKQNSFYKSKHSDEIFLTADFAKQIVKEPGQIVPYVFMLKTNILSDTEDENSYDNYKKYVKEVVYNNSKIQAYYPFNHFWGDDSREFVEIFVLDSFSDAELSQYEANALLAKMFPDEEVRKEFLASIFSAIESQNTSFYKNIPSLSK